MSYFLLAEGRGKLLRLMIMKPWATSFYESKQWQDCRNSYAASVGNLCERCQKKGLVKPGEIVHHKTELTPANIKDPMIALNWNNLELVCRECHLELHGRGGRRYKIDALGRVSPLV